MEQEIRKIENASKAIWGFAIAFMAIVLVVLAGSIIIILLQGGHQVSGKEVVRGAVFPLVLFIPIWAALARKAERPASRQSKIIKVMLITAFILLAANVMVFWLL